MNEQLHLIQLTNSVMTLCKFNNDRRRRWMIWAARGTTCPTCKAKPYKPCVNMTSTNLRKPVSKRAVNRWPHEARVDRQKLLDGLVLRGYYSST